MTVLLILVGCVLLVAGGVDLFIVGVAGAITLVAYGALWCWSIVSDYQYTQRRAHAAFIREVVRQHQRAREARQAGERA
ncbi:hypothetical protein [Pseudoxanthomonas sp. SE1]|uniref:hypothetical protein n=1 Tax=Pseudoxanthomonas sp. SE1 TaxID=1664560 RepID=UPI00240E54CF|nr:hypothetical protein [Pseudoxanthomonas sp. SE1]WFC43762.1 hypothetical protein OY559_09825 [Pseudoxanthomonas sp. SE1]